MTNSNHVRRPIRTSFIFGLSVLIFLYTLMIAFVNIPHYGWESGNAIQCVLGAIAGAIALAGSMAHLRRKLLLGFVMVAVAAFVLLVVFVMALSQEGSGGDFYLVWLSVGVVCLVVGGLIFSCRMQGRQEEGTTIGMDQHPVEEEPIFRTNVKPRRIRDLVPSEFPGVDPQAFQAWQRAVKTANLLWWVVVVCIVPISMAMMLKWGIISSFLGTISYLIFSLVLVNTLPARRFEKLGISREQLQQACNRKKLSW